VEGIEAEDAAPEAGLLQIEMAPGWTTAGGMPELRGGGAIVKAVAGEPVLFASLDGTVYAYRPECPACHAALPDGALDGADLVCAACGVRYDTRLAGRCLDDPELHLDPVPLLEDGGGMVRVALA
jgi:nitrite reductase/ring-hydroxylating ferredoxin subunit